jgi:hypothetical protein
VAISNRSHPVVGRRARSASQSDSTGYRHQHGLAGDVEAVVATRRAIADVDERQVLATLRYVGRPDQQVGAESLVPRRS